MKPKFTQTLSVFSILFIGCTLPCDYDIDSQPKSVSTKVSPDNISTYIHAYKGIDSTRSEDIKIDPILNGTDTVMYLVNYANGWEVLSADKRAPKVLVMCKEGNISVEELISNPAEQTFYDKMGGYISYLHANPDVVTDATEDWSDLELASTNEIESWVLIGTEVVEDIEDEQNHLTVTRWGQGGPNNKMRWDIKAPYLSPDKSEHCWTGCVPVAAAQMLYYLHYKTGAPEKIYGDVTVTSYIPSGQNSITIKSGDITLSNYTSATWNLMPLTENESGATDEQYGYVSSLMVYLGYLLNAKYKTTSTSASQYDLVNIFKNHFNITCTQTAYSDVIIDTQIREKKMPVILSVSYKKDGVRQGHSIIVDGYYYKYKKTRKTYVWQSLSGPKYKTVYDEDSMDMFCINWGYDSEGMTYDNSNDTVWYNMYGNIWEAGGHPFDTRETMIYNFVKKQ